MRRLLLFGGTTEAREILERGVPALCCVATDWGAELARSFSGPGVEVRVGRLDEPAMEALIRAEHIACVIDATHPYAVEVTRNIRTACANTGVPLLRLSRPPAVHDSDNAILAGSCREAAELLNELLNECEGNVLLTVGSKELREFTAVRDYKTRLYARVLPTSDVLRACEGLGFDPAHIIAMQGPFSLEMDRAMLPCTGASVLVTKDGGAAGGVEAKLRAAHEAGARVILIARPDDSAPNHMTETVQSVQSVDECVLWARRMLGLERLPLFPMMIDLEGRPVLIVGGGAVASRRAATLLKCGARVRAVSPEFHDAFPHEVEQIKRPFELSDLEGVTLATAASDDREVNHAVAQEARARGVPVSVADAAAEGDFFFPSLIAEGPTAASVSSAGLSCSLTRRLSDRLRAVWADWVREETSAMTAHGAATCR